MFKKITTIIFVSIVPLLIIQGFQLRFPISKLTNDYLTSAYQATKKNEIDRNVVIVNISDFPTDVIRDQIEILSLYGPAAIVVDYIPDDCYFSDSSTLVNYNKIILPISVNETGIQKSKNCYSSSAQYGFTDMYSSSFFEPFKKIGGSTYSFIGTKAVELSDSIIHKELLHKLSSEKVIINYAGNIDRFLYLGDLLSTKPDDLKSVTGKIVLLGYTGTNSPVPQSTQDHDAHNTPTGLMYGVVIIANIIHTLTSDLILPANLFWESLTAIILIIVSITISVALLKLPFSYVFIKVAQLILVALTFVVASFALHQYHFIINAESLYWIELLVPELAFWTLREANR